MPQATIDSNNKLASENVAVILYSIQPIDIASPSNNTPTTKNLANDRLTDSQTRARCLRVAEVICRSTSGDAMVIGTPFPCLDLRNPSTNA